MTDGVVPFFEGTEKRIEIDFVGKGDLRRVPRHQWTEVVKLSGTQILHVKETPAFTSFLLSESSLLIYPATLVLKTCGVTVPIRAVSKIFELAESQGMEPEWLCYSRKNFLAPNQQPFVHQSKEAEIALCDIACRGKGDGYVLGPMTGEHWLIYDAQWKHGDGREKGEFHIDIMMYGLPKDVQEIFYTSDPEGSLEAAAEMSRASGLADIAATIGGEIDDYCFSPCGYSCNVHAGNYYAIVHVTPQENCSYASFETNFGSNRWGQPASDVGERLNSLVGKVVDAFRPQKLTVTLFTDDGAERALGNAPFGAADKRYVRRNRTSTHFEHYSVATIVNYEVRTKKRPREEASEEVKSEGSVNSNSDLEVSSA